MSTAASDKKKERGGASAARDCAHCGAEEGSKKHLYCSLCKMTYYCSKNCQSIHWKKGGHKQFCVDPSKRTVASNNTGKGADAAVTAPGTSGNAAVEECAICLDPLASSSARKLPCGHTFHASCLRNARRFGLNQSCALCRSADIGADGGPTGGVGGDDRQERYDGAMRHFLAITQRVGAGSQVSEREVSDTMAALEPLAMDGTFSESVRAVAALAGLHYSLGRIAESQKWSRGPAEEGHAVSQTNLGMALLSSAGAAPDSSGKTALVAGKPRTSAQRRALTEAAQWFTKASIQGDAHAQQALGALYSSGLGVPLDCAQAAKWRRAAAEQGDSGSCFALGNFYEEGSEDGRVPLSLPDALKWYLEGARLSSKECAFNGSVFLRNGRGAGRLCDGSAGPYEAGALRPDPSSAAALGLCRQAADAGHASAQHSMGIACENGTGVAKDAPAAARWYLKAAHQGHVKGNYQYGCLCFTGKGVEQDDDRAQIFLEAALAAFEAAPPEKRTPGLDGAAMDMLDRIEKKRALYAKLTPAQKKMLEVMMAAQKK